MTAIDSGDGPPPVRRSPLFWVVLGLVALLIAGAAIAIAANLGGGGGAGSVTVPSVLGLTKDEAKTKLDAAGLKADFQDEPSDTVPEGSVVSQDPAPNTTTSFNSSFTVNR